MEKLNQAVLEQLINSSQKPAVTIYIPMHTTAAPPHISENQIRFKNLLNKAIDRLSPHGAEHELAKALQAQLHELHDDLGFWENQTPGLLICATPVEIRMFHLPIDTEEYVAVDDRFHLAPVIGILNDVRNFYLLILAQHNPELYKGGLYGLETTKAALPANAKAALNIDENNQKTEIQGTAAGPSTKGAASSPTSRMGWFNGRGGARNPQEEDRLRYFRLIDKAVCDATRDNLPLLIAGLEAEAAEYRSISRYPRILQGMIHGSHTNDDLRSLFNKARAVVWQELVAPEHRSTIEEYQRISGARPDRVSSDIKSILDAARQGRVDKLLARMSRRTTDTVQDRTEALPRLTFPSQTDSKQLNDAALSVWQASGRVYNLEPEEMPANGLMAARLRY
jgi:hypothetical protein